MPISSSPESLTRATINAQNGRRAYRGFQAMGEFKGQEGKFFAVEPIITLHYGIAESIGAATKLVLEKFANDPEYGEQDVTKNPPRLYVRQIGGKGE